MRHFALFPALACTVALSCSISSLEMAGGSTSTPNERVMGKLFFSTGAPAPRTVVRLIPSSYDQIKGIPLSSLPTDTTDDSGAYSFAAVDSGTYTIQAVQLDDRTRSLITGIHVDRDTIVVPADTLRVPGAINLLLPPDVNSALGYIYIPGTSYTVFLNNRTDFIILDSVPANVIPALSYSTIQSTSTTTIRYAVPVNSNDTTVVWNPLWKFARTLVLNTTVAGADVSGDVTDFPVLVRLKSGNFDFSQEKTGGADIRFTKSDNTFLPYEIERWDSVNRRAEIWVKLDTIYGNDSMQSITMYWGNPNAASESNGAAVFETANDFAAVWHLDNDFSDATAGNHGGTNFGTTDTVGIIGGAKKFDGSSYIQVPGLLGTPQSITLSAWVYLDSTIIFSQDIVSLGDAVALRADRVAGPYYGTEGFFCSTVSASDTV
ncbi:MAG: DUF2341 domain-containing protein, partial [Chitinispirillaceae bacterium]|nr:DUF2341 domain-containing protein [Chitinispirillaceae bacterium]